MKIGIRWKWMAAHLAVGGLVLLFMIVYLGARLQDYFETRFENRWRRELVLAESYLASRDLSTMTMAEADRWADEVGRTLAMRVTYIDPEGKVIGDSDVDFGRLNEVENHGDRPEVKAALAKGFGASRRHSSTVDRDLFYLATPVGSKEAPLGVLRVAVPTAEIDESLSQIEHLIWFAGLLGFGLVIITGFFTSRPMTARLHDMSEAAKRFSHGDFSHGLSADTTDELGDLSGALNTMGRDLQTYVEAVTRERDRLQAILDAMVEGVIVIDFDGKILLANHSLQGIFGIENPIVGLSAHEVFRNAQLQEALEKAKTDKKDAMVTFDVLKPFRKCLEAHIAVLGEPEAAAGLVAVFHDITQLQHLEKVRRDFVANVSHELRTPLTAIKGYVETLLQDGTVDPGKSHEFLTTVLNHSDRMTKLVADLLSLSRLESPESETALEETDVVEIVQRVAMRFHSQANKNGAELKLELPDKLPPVKGLPAEIETMLENLIDNAMKYGEQGKVVRVSVEELESEVRISVADKGIGIPMDDQPRIFERFYRVDKGRSRELGGTGLGLSIVKHIVQRHHGRIWVESKVGEGATFYVTLRKA